MAEDSAGKDSGWSITHKSEYRDKCKNRTNRMLRSQSPSCLIALIATVILVGLCGCRAGKKVRAPKQCPPEAAVVVNENRVEYANVDRAVGVSSFDIAPPLTSATELPEESFPLTLDEAIQIAFENTLILRDLGARVLQNPEFVASSSDPAIQSTDPIFAHGFED